MKRNKKIDIYKELLINNKIEIFKELFNKAIILNINTYIKNRKKSEKDISYTIKNDTDIDKPDIIIDIISDYKYIGSDFYLNISIKNSLINRVIEFKFDNISIEKFINNIIEIYNDYINNKYHLNSSDKLIFNILSYSNNNIKEFKNNELFYEATVHSISFTFYTKDILDLFDRYISIANELDKKSYKKLVNKVDADDILLGTTLVWISTLYGHKNLPILLASYGLSAIIEYLYIKRWRNK